MTRPVLSTWPYFQVVMTYCSGGDLAQGAGVDDAIEGCQAYRGRKGNVSTVPQGEAFELRNDESLPARNGRTMSISFKAGPYAAHPFSAPPRQPGCP